MKLIELKPRWVGLGESSCGIRIGITFECPHCHIQRLGVHFSNPIDPQGWLNKGVTRPSFACEWKRHGESFDALSLTPSVDSSRIDVGGHWHGFITNGEVA